MAIFDVTFTDGDQVSGAVNIGGGMITAVFLPADSDNASFNLEYSPDGTDFYPICDESDTPLAITYKADGAMHQINPPVRAPIVRLKGVTGVESPALTCEIHTV